MARRQRSTLNLWFAALTVLLVVGVLWLFNDLPVSVGTDEPTAPRTSASTSSQQPSSRSSPSPASTAGGRDPESGLSWVQVDELPAQAEDTLELIDDGGPYPYGRDGVVFGNFEGVLPRHERGYYHEYTVPTPGENDRGARRIVTGDEDEFFYTGDHYASFERIAR
jgi:ribonuclease T1